MVSSVHLFPALCSDLNSDYLFLLSDEFPILITSACSAIRKMGSLVVASRYKIKWNMFIWRSLHRDYIYYYKSLLIMFDIWYQ